MWTPFCEGKGKAGLLRDSHIFIVTRWLQGTSCHELEHKLWLQCLLCGKVNVNCLEAVGIPAAAQRLHQ